MRKLVTILTLFASFSALAQPKVKYDLCQDTVDQLFTVDNLVEAQLNSGVVLSEDKSFPEIRKNNTPLFKINDKGELDEEESKVMKSKFDESTGVYLFRLKDDIVKKQKKAHVAKYEAMLKNGDIKKIPDFDIHKKKYIVKKDDQGRIYSIEEKGNMYCADCSRKVELSYSKKKCLPRNVVDTDSEGNEKIVANSVACKNLDDIKKKLFKRMEKLNKCRDLMNEHYSKASEVASEMLGKIEEEANGREKYAESDLVQNLKSIQEKAKHLRESNQVLKDRIQKQSDFDHVYNELLADCNTYLGKNVIKAKKVYKEKNGIFEIKKDKPGKKVDNQLEELRKVRTK
jgi:hypothetical protein